MGERVPNRFACTAHHLYFVLYIPMASWGPMGEAPLQMRSLSRSSGHPIAYAARMLAAGSTWDEHRTDDVDLASFSAKANGSNWALMLERRANCCDLHWSMLGPSSAIFLTANSRSWGGAEGASRGEGANIPASKYSKGSKPVGTANNGAEMPAWRLLWRRSARKDERAAFISLGGWGNVWESTLLGAL